VRSITIIFPRQLPGHLLIFPRFDKCDGGGRPAI
jgi:hypothetical protein